MNITNQAGFKAMVIVFVLPFPIVFLMHAVGFEGEGFWEDYGAIAGIFAIPVTILFVLLYVVRGAVAKYKK